MRHSELPDEQRVVVTGCGAVTPCGEGVEPLLDAVMAGRSALRTVSLDDGRQSGSGREIGGGLVYSCGLERFGDVDKTSGLALAAAEQVVAALPDEARRALSVFVASGKPAMRLLERVHRGLVERGPASIPADFVRHVVPSAPADAIAARFGCGGLRQPVVGACSTGLDCVAMAARFLRAGRGRAVLAGSSEASLTPLTVAAFERLGVLANGAADPARAIKPFDRDRTGFLIGEGAGMLLVETLASARQRGAEILAEVSGWAVVGDAHHLTTLAPHGAGVAHAVTSALDVAGLAPADIDHINAHGTATKLNDVIETHGIRMAFGRHADRIKICSTKPITGHLLSASASVELIIAIGAMRSGLAPPTINLDEVDPACDLDYTPHAAVECPMRHALVLNYGFGGHVGAVVLSGWTER